LFKTWQIGAVSLVFLALLFSGVIVGSMHGTDSELQVFPTVPPRAENGDSPAPTPVPGATQLELVAANLAFDKSSLSAPAGKPVSVILDNQDASVPHNSSLYADRGYTQSVFTGELDNGPATKTYTFDAPSTPGAYFFRCDVHPDTMTGQFTIN
jgi:plastocyanin